jgi:Zn finger protein HypA/HybF involved in hydrogenase expression
MASGYQARCRDCGEQFQVVAGPLMSGAWFARCTDCGASTTTEQIFGDEERIQADHGTCECGGVYRTDAQPRCPTCRSLDLDIDEEPDMSID